MTPEERAKACDRESFLKRLNGARRQALIVKHIRESVAEEREACAQLARRMYPPSTVGSVNAMSVAAETIAIAIRART